MNNPIHKDEDHSSLFHHHIHILQLITILYHYNNSSSPSSCPFITLESTLISCRYAVDEYTLHYYC